jgi:hypothetical protein
VNGQTISRISQKNQANYVNGRFDPADASAQRAVWQKAAYKLKPDQQQLDAEIVSIVQKHKKAD